MSLSTKNIWLDPLVPQFLTSDGQPPPGSTWLFPLQGSPVCGDLATWDHRSISEEEARRHYYMQTAQLEGPLRDATLAHRAAIGEVFPGLETLLERLAPRPHSPASKP